MNNLKTNPKGLDVIIYRVQKKLYDKLSTMWAGVELFGYDRCYLSNRNGVKSIDYYVSDKEYENLIVAEKNKFFFTAENEVKNVGINYYETSIELYFIVNVSEIKPDILHRADEEVRKDVLNLLQTMSDTSIDYVVFNTDNVFNKYFFNQVIDLEPYHCFKVVLKVNKYHLNNKLCI